ncbi:hypothetical protein K7432_010979 [Basidiobolus ranarum]|uniref:Uncharacterized protein n=1 Tax=Basidiobolus ranarum TaxID=34480 RepID=A0ABR2WMX1_9FUNG
MPFPRSLPKLLICDVDGTLLNPSEKVSYRTSLALAKAQAAGIIIMIGSGRSPRSIQKVIDQFEGLLVPDDVICCNGALSYNPTTKLVSFPILLKSSDAKEVVQQLRRHIGEELGGRPGFACEVLSDSLSKEGTSFICDKVWEAQRKHTIYYNYTVVDSMEDFLSSEATDERVAQGVVKLLALDRDRNTTVLYESLPTELAHSEKATLTLSGPYFLEISCLGVNKGRGLEAYCNGHGIDAKDVVAFGDMLNDLEMLSWAGRGFCMGNGHPDVKKIAYRVIGTNAEDGVAKEIEDWF